MNVTALSVTAVKATRLQSVEEIELTPAGARGNRRFFVIDERDRLVNGKRCGELQSVVAACAVDRGRRGAVSLISCASLARLAEAAGESDVDPRRFRMLVEINGVAAHAEDAWVGRTVRLAEAEVRFHGHVGRCLITSRDPDTGRVDLPTLDVLGSYRADLQTTKPLPFGIYGEVVREGTVRVGDQGVLDG